MNNNQSNQITESSSSDKPPAFDIGAIFKTIQTLTQRVSSELKTEPGNEDSLQQPPDIAKVFSSIGKILSEPSKEMEDVKNSLSNLGKGAGAGAGAMNPMDMIGALTNGGGNGGGLGSMFSSLLNQPNNTKDVHVTHQDEPKPEEDKPLMPINDKTVVLEVTEQELNENIIKKFTIDVTENGTPDIFALELPLEKNKFFYKFFLKERNLNLSFLLDIK